MHGVARVVGAWLDIGGDPVVVRAPLTQGVAGASRGEALAVGADGQAVGALLRGAVNDVADRLVDAARSSGCRQVETVAITAQVAERCGLTSGGQVTVVADRADLLPVDWLGGRTPIVFSGPMGVGGAVVAIGDDHPGTLVGDAARQLVGTGRSGAVLVDGTSLVEVYIPDPHVVVVGSGQVAEALAAQARLLDWHAEATGDLEGALAALGDLGACDAVVVLSHDAGLDAPFLQAALAGDVGYVGALGSRRTQARRRDDLLAAGVAPDDVDRVHGPAGLDLGAATPAEIALSICAEILVTRTGRSAESLRTGTGPIRP